jgi:UPF0755 protein
MVVFGFIFVLSGGDPITYARIEYLRMTLAGRQGDLARSVGTDETEVIFEVSYGDSPQVIAENLFLNGLILDKELFVNYARFEGYDREFEAGIYFLKQTMIIPDIALMLTDSRNSSITFRVAEGWRIEEIADAIDEHPRFSFSSAEFLILASDSSLIELNLAAELGIPTGVSLEGFMFPDTYILAPNITAVGLIERLLERFLEATETQLRMDANAQGLTMRNVVTLASIVEREAVWEDEHPLIASVYRNRLDIGMKLEADPTVQYGLDGTRELWWPQITQADYQGVNSLYNTYLYSGLPPGPIANPGLAAIQAAVYPTESDYFFFRARCDGSNYHNFTTTYEEHLANGC